jgi:hypothetical protein
MSALGQVQTGSARSLTSSQELSSTESATSFDSVGSWMFEGLNGAEQVPSKSTRVESGTGPNSAPKTSSSSFESLPPKSAESLSLPGYGPGEYDAMLDGLAEIRRGKEILGQPIPTDHVGINQSISHLVTARNSINANLERLDPESDNAAIQDTRNGLHEMRGRIDARIGSLESFRDGGPVSLAEIKDARRLNFLAAARVIDRAIGDDPSLANNRQLTALKNLYLHKANEHGQDVVPQGGLKEQLGNHPKELKKELVSALDSARKENAGIKDRIKITFAKTGKEVAGLFKSAMTETLNKDLAWAPIRNRVEFVKGGVGHAWQSEITPASKLATLAASYQADGVNGIASSSSKETLHALNLAVSEMKDERGQVVFRGVRHGILSAYGLKDPHARAAAADNRAREVLLGALAADPELLRQAQAQGDGDGPLTISVSSMSLVTPDALRNKLFGASSRERMQLRDQLGAWSRLNNGGPIQLDIPNGLGGTKTVTIQPEITAFNFGVNPFAVKSEGANGFMPAVGMAGRMFGVWREVEETNRRGLTSMMGPLDQPGLGGKVQAFLNGAADPKDKLLVFQLANQVRDMWNSGAYRDAEGDPFKMAARVQLLAHKLGMMPAWNCKSGKDRTGTLDAEMKYLTAQMELTGNVPQPGPLTTPDDQGMYRQFSLHTGNLEVQKLNTGIGGYKTANQVELHQRMGNDEEASRRYEGGSGFVKA